MDICRRSIYELLDIYIQQFMDIMSKENSRDRDENNMEVDVFISRWLSEKNFERAIFYILL